MTKRKSERAERRARERAAQKLAQAREKQWKLGPGGSANRPLEVQSASVVEPLARAEVCFFCGGAVRSVDHRAETLAGLRLRVVDASCGQCGAVRTWYFRLVTELLS